MTKKILTITASREGFRRAGHAFGREPVQLAESDLTEEQIAMLKAEPMLTVIESEGEAQDTDPDDDRGANIDNPDADDEQPKEPTETDAEQESAQETKPARKSKK